ncbi:MAG: transcriptional repressor LexA [Sphingopyxis sp.]|jgi:repressor LexA|uniref:transcriptional repressor LexA n=1 Tax=unclassified Sphingopyxis TaxID=2614943 RepID=UPI0007317A2F|nr:MULTISPECIES: transcriptional repressor LexA [unclassified Sphingopyxis]KTE02170.1 LexA family transcriptional regulator [Sphingopyxis sp. H012]KTE09919.1 LexA family transcriptional regulator [Sphingopyxis sp. H053]KTE15316.1 LexA family transcriptional regulator [Sphingopyxis sp. H093]KTE26199.1 LexA family transcriptional regulator [Sphingopyxis sp. H080]KTE33638.1 LexA family transcriptional regulator [Sphingopyxis sp. H038]
MLTAKQHELLHFIQERLDTSGISPSFEEMKEALGLKSKSGIHRLISALEERGFLRRLPNRARALEVLKVPEAAKATTPVRENVVPLRKAPPALKPIAANDIIEVPLHGKIAAGVPIEAFEDHNNLAVPAALLGSGEHYALEVSGDSMVEAGIFDGDYALIQKASTAREGDIVVALVDGQDATLKYFRREGQMIRLDPANAAYEPQRYPADRVIVQGRLSGLLRRYH